MFEQTLARDSTGLKYEKCWQAIGWFMVLVVIWLSLTPKPPQLPSFFGWDKAQHVTAYAGLMYWFGMCFVRHWHWPVFMLALGIGLEFVQGATGLRSNDPYDILANMIGVVVGLFLADTPMGQWLVFVDRLFANQFGLPDES